LESHFDCPICEYEFTTEENKSPNDVGVCPYCDRYYPTIQNKVVDESKKDDTIQSHSSGDNMLTFLIIEDTHKVNETVTGVDTAIKVAQNVYNETGIIPTVALDEDGEVFIDDLAAQQVLNQFVHDSICGKEKNQVEYIIFNPNSIHQNNQADALENGNCTIVTVDLKNSYEVEMFGTMVHAFDQEAEGICIELVKKEPKSVEVKFSYEAVLSQGRTASAKVPQDIIDRGPIPVQEYIERNSQDWTDIEKDLPDEEPDVNNFKLLD
jgi:hypothetical protein